MFKIALMTYICFHNLAPACIKDMLFHKPITSHNAWIDNGHLKPEPKLGLNFVKSQVMFCSFGSMECIAVIC